MNEVGPGKYFTDQVKTFDAKKNIVGPDRRI